MQSRCWEKADWGGAEEYRRETEHRKQGKRHKTKKWQDHDTKDKQTKTNKAKLEVNNVKCLPKSLPSNRRPSQFITCIKTRKEGRKGNVCDAKVYLLEYLDREVKKHRGISFTRGSESAVHITDVVSLM